MEKLEWHPCQKRVWDHCKKCIYNGLEISIFCICKQITYEIKYIEDKKQFPDNMTHNKKKETILAHLVKQWLTKNVKPTKKSYVGLKRTTFLRGPGIFKIRPKKGVKREN